MAPRTCVILVGLLVALAGCRSKTPPAAIDVTISGQTFSLEPALDTTARTRGLMDRASIDEHGGMLFIFPETEMRGFWMDRCEIDIDIMFLDAHGRVTALHRMVAEEQQRESESRLEYERRLPRYSSHYPAQYVIELKSGWLDRLAVKVEDKIELDVDHVMRFVE